MDVTTETTSKRTEMVSRWGFSLEWIATAATEVELSALISGKPEVIHDVTVSSEDVNDVFIRRKFNNFFFASLPVATKVLRSFNDNVWTEDEVVSFPAENELVIVEDCEFPNLVAAWWVLSKSGGITERNGVTVGLSSLEFGFLESAWSLEDWLNNQVKIVDVSTETSLKDSEVSSERSMGFERITAWSSEFEFSALVSGKTEEVKDISVSTKERGEELIRAEFNADFLDTRVDVTTEMFSTLNGDVWSEDEVVSLPSEDELVVVVDGDLPDLVGAWWVLVED